jgi:hypothetical protein
MMLSELEAANIFKSAQGASIFAQARFGRTRFAVRQSRSAAILPYHRAPNNLYGLVGERTPVYQEC